MDGVRTVSNWGNNQPTHQSTKERVVACLLVLLLDANRMLSLVGALADVNGFHNKET